MRVCATSTTGSSRGRRPGCAALVERRRRAAGRGRRGAAGRRRRSRAPGALRRLDDRFAAAGRSALLRDVPQLGLLLVAVLLAGAGGARWPRRAATRRRAADVRSQRAAALGPEVGRRRWRRTSTARERAPSSGRGAPRTRRTLALVSLCSDAARPARRTTLLEGLEVLRVYLGCRATRAEVLLDRRAGPRPRPAALYAATAARKAEDRARVRRRSRAAIAGRPSSSSGSATSTSSRRGSPGGRRRPTAPAARASSRAVVRGRPRRSRRCPRCRGSAAVELAPRGRRCSSSCGCGRWRPSRRPTVGRGRPRAGARDGDMPGAGALAGAADLDEVYALRHEVFVVGQDVPEDMERDELDADALHAVARLRRRGRRHRAAAGARGGRRTDAAVGRMAVADAVRGRGRRGGRAGPARGLAARARAGRRSSCTPRRTRCGFYERAGYVAFGDGLPRGGHRAPEHAQALWAVGARPRLLTRVAPVPVGAACDHL